MKKKLEIGILIDNPLISSWELAIIEEIDRSDYARIALILVDEKDEESALQKNSHVNYIYKLHQRLDAKIFLKKNNYAEKKDLFNFLRNVPAIKLRSITNNGLKHFIPGDISKIREFNLDVIIKLNYGIIGGEILKVPVYGVWSYSMKNFGSEKEDTTGYYEIPHKDQITSSTLMILKDNGNKNPVIAHAVESTCAYSVSLNRDKLFRRASFFLPAVVKGIYTFGQTYLDKLEEKYKQICDEPGRKMPVPSFPESIKNIWKSGIIFLSKIFKKISLTDPFSWTLLFSIRPDNDFLHNNYGNFARLKPSRNKFWADPFVISRGDRYYLFVEEFIYSKNRGHISVLELDRNGLIQNVQKIIEKPYHLSYPFIFESDDVYYIIPETSGNRTVDLYRCTEFPGKWVFVKTIMSNVNAVDSTLFHYNNKWWLFTVIDKLENSAESSPELYLFYTDNFLSEKWVSHPMNPVVSDVRSARPAGKIFIRDREIYRPSQNCAGRYGNSFDINRILILTEADYKEEKVIKVRPEWDSKLKGTHTFNSDGDFTVVDAYSFRRRFI